MFPSFVAAAALQAAVAPNGMLEELVPVLAGRLPTVDGFAGAWLDIVSGVGLSDVLALELPDVFKRLAMTFLTV